MKNTPDNLLIFFLLISSITCYVISTCRISSWYITNFQMLPICMKFSAFKSITIKQAIMSILHLNWGPFRFFLSQVITRPPLKIYSKWSLCQHLTSGRKQTRGARLSVVGRSATDILRGTSSRNFLVNSSARFVTDLRLRIVDFIL